MKTAISIPDSIFTAADVLAQKEGISRSELYTHAVEIYINSRIQKNITESLDKVYSENDSEINKDMQTMQTMSLSKDSW